MLDNVIYGAFDKKKISYQSKYSERDKHEKITDIFAGSSGLPVLLENEIIRDIKERVYYAESFGQFKINTKIFMRKQRARADYEDLAEAYIEFFLQTRQQDQEETPFLIFQAEHKKDFSNPGNIETLFSLHKGRSGKGKAIRNIISKGYDYKCNIAPYISQQISARLVEVSYSDPEQAYEA